MKDKDNDANIKALADGLQAAISAASALPYDPEADRRGDEMFRRVTAGWKTTPVRLKRHIVKGHK